MHICTQLKFSRISIINAVFIALLFTPTCKAITCYRCDSIALEECAMTVNELDTLPFVNCPSELSCIMSIVDKITYRGCGNQTPTIGATYSKYCRENLCNKGTYPPGRLKCHHCTGEECIGKPSGKPRPCRFHYEEDKCYTEVRSSTEIYRGCASDTNHTISSDVVYCEYNGCNDIPAATKLQCVKCDSNETLGCKMDLFYANSNACNITRFETCSVDSLLTHKQSCFTYQRDNRVVRGCTPELPEELSRDLERITECDSHDHCNAKCTNRLRCLNCDSISNEFCYSNTTEISSTTCGSAEASSCYACEYDDWSTQRGCGTVPKRNDITRCYECDAVDGCNALHFIRCYQCTSDMASGCATWERPGGIYIEECETPAANCLIANFQNGTTVRGCQREDFNCTIDGLVKCNSCAGSFCNKGVFPETRLTCYQCAGGVACEQLTIDALPCVTKSNAPNSLQHACLEYYDVYSGQIVRGCNSNAQLYYECMLRNDGNGCHLCYENACNASPGKTLRTQYLIMLGNVKGTSLALKASKSAAAAAAADATTTFLRLNMNCINLILLLLFWSTSISMHLFC